MATPKRRATRSGKGASTPRIAAAKPSNSKYAVNVATDWNTPPPSLLRQCFDQADVDAIVKATGIALPAGDDTYRRYVVSGTYPDDANEAEVQGPRAQVLVRRLDDNVRHYALQLALQKAPTDRQKARRFGEIEGKAQALLETLGTPQGNPETMPLQLRAGGTYLRSDSLGRQADLDAQGALRGPAPLTLDQAVRSIAGLARWAHGAKEALRQPNPVRESFGMKRADRGNPDAALNYLLALLSRTYAAVWAPGATGEDKPIIVASFARAVLRRLHEKRPELVPKVPTLAAIGKRLSRMR